jgi:hypothetical protein
MNFGEDKPRMTPPDLRLLIALTCIAWLAVVGAWHVVATLIEWVRA